METHHPRAERWRQVEEIFQAAVELPTEELSGFLASTCGEDQALRAEVDALIAAHRQPNELLATGSFAINPQRRHPGEIEVGGTIGPYTLLRELGRGGMSVVFLAVRTDRQVERRVALKLVSHGNHPLLVQRLCTERQILATLDHANIAKLYDSGTTDDGLPYFVMEHVEGTRIDRYCDARRLGTTERLELFRQVCAAVQVAHQNLVVHRDIKPSNILVTPAGVPKLLDFGIAKLLEPDAADRSGQTTLTGLRPMTPCYASPEQLRGKTITTASDVYSLGVLLYELLTGRLPYPESARESVERRRALPQPSVAVMSPAEVLTTDEDRDRRGPEQVSYLRDTQPAQLRRQLAGDVDSIVLEALRWEPEERYRSVEQLAEDIGRHLDGLPVKARRAGWRYRAGKLVRRNKLAVAALAAFVGLALASAIAMAVLTARVAHEGEKARQERDRASQVATFLVDLFEVTEAAGNAVSARELLESGAQRARELDVEPEQRAALYNTLGAAFVKLGLFDRALPFLEEALAVRRGILDATHPDVADSLYHLAQLLGEKGEFRRAEILLQEAVAIQRQAHGKELELARSLGQLARLLVVKGRYDEAEKLHREALALRRELLGDQHPEVAVGLNYLAEVLIDMRQMADVEALSREAIAILSRAPGKKYLLDQVDALTHLARALEVQADFEAAETHYQEALAIQRQALGDRHPDLAVTLTSLGVLGSQRGDYEAAEHFYRQALEMRRELLGEEHPLVAWSWANLAQLYQIRGDVDRAEQLYRECLANLRKHLPAGSSIIGFPLIHLGLLLTAKGDPESAEPLLREALDLRRAALPPSSPLVARPQIALGQCLVAQRAYDEAEPLLTAGYRKLELLPGQEAWIRRALENLVALYQARDQAEKIVQYTDLLKRLESETR